MWHYKHLHYQVSILHLCQFDIFTVSNVKLYTNIIVMRL